MQMISMNTLPRLCAWCAVALCLHPASAAPAPSGESGPQLTIELRDGSHVVARSLEETVNFHSPAMGDLKPTWAAIRSIEYGDGTNTARLTMTNGDAFTVEAGAEALRVETGFGQTALPVKLIRSVKVSPPARAKGVAGANPARLTIELRDGSRVAGKGLEETLSFHSAAMGDLKLTWADIRSIRYASANAEMARLTATNGDVYEVQFAATAVVVETSFGKTELPVKLIRSVTVSTAGGSGQLPPGLAALWSGEGDANDSAGENPGTMHGGVTFANGQAGQAFSFDGSTGYVSVPHNPLWDFGNNAFTIALWANFSSPGGAEALIADDDGVGSGQPKWVLFHGFHGDGLTFHIRGPASEVFGNFPPANFGGNGRGVRRERTASDDAILTMPFSPVAGQWYHIALTRDGSFWTYYVNGVAIGTTTALVQVPSMNAPLTIGNTEELYFFKGQMDQVSIYNRALSGEEIQAVCEEQNHGELPPPPPIPSRPMGVEDALPRVMRAVDIPAPSPPGGLDPSPELR
jgi:hypothetical protein